MKTSIIMMGLQASGKSEYVKRHLSDYVRVNLDTLHTRNKERILIEECIASGRSYVVDNTNPTRKDRIRYIPRAKEAGYRVVGIFVHAPFETCLARNDTREGKAKICYKGIAGTAKIFERPSFDEGFDELFFLRNTEPEMTLEPWRDHD